MMSKLANSKIFMDVMQNLIGVVIGRTQILFE